MRVALTDRFCAGAKARGARQTDYFDETTTGLSLRVTEDGRRTWTYLYTSPKTGKRTRMTLAGYPATSLAAARTMALEAGGQIDQGTDPRDAKAAAEASATTVATLAALYFAKPHKRTGRPRKTAAEIQRRFDRNILPVIGSAKITDVQRRDVTSIVSPIMRRGAPTEAARTFEDVRAMLRWALGQGYIDRNPAEAMEPPVPKSPPRERVLADPEIKALWRGLPKALARSVQCQRIIKICLVTAQRVGEVAGMQASELDLAAATWTIPATRAKNGFEHTVPLSALAIGLIEAALADAGKDAKFVFPAPEGAGSLPAAAVARTILRAHETDKEHPSGRFGIAHFTAHDLRRTAVSKMAELGVVPIVLGHIINHRSVTKAGITLSAYQTYDYTTERRQALDLWGKQLQAIVAADSAKAKRRAR
jgi:integrase